MMYVMVLEIEFVGLGILLADLVSLCIVYVTFYVMVLDFI